MPHLSYIDAVHAALDEAELTPDQVDAGASDDKQRELFADLAWPEDTVSLRWTSTADWRFDAPHADGPLFVSGVAAPDVIVDCVRLLLEGHPPISGHDRWDRAAELEAALYSWEGVA